METLEIQEADTRYRKFKIFSKIINKVNNRFIPPHQKERLSQIISDGILDELPSEVKIFELIPDRIYSKRETSSSCEAWCSKDLNQHIKDLIDKKNHNCPINHQKTYKEKNFSINFDNYDNSDKSREIYAYLKILKYCQKSPLEKEVKENMYQTISDIFLENTPKDVKSFNLINGIISHRDDLETGESWDLSNMREYIKE